MRCNRVTSSVTNAVRTTLELASNPRPQTQAQTQTQAQEVLWFPSVGLSHPKLKNLGACNARAREEVTG